MAGFLVPMAHVHFGKLCVRGLLKAQGQQKTMGFEGLCVGGGGVGGGLEAVVQTSLFSSSSGWNVCNFQIIHEKFNI